LLPFFLLIYHCIRCCFVSNYYFKFDPINPLKVLYHQELICFRKYCVANQSLLHILFLFLIFLGLKLICIALSMLYSVPLCFQLILLNPFRIWRSKGLKPLKHRTISKQRIFQISLEWSKDKFRNRQLQRKDQEHLSFEEAKFNF